MQVHCVQLDIAWEAKERNFARVREMLRGATVAEGSLVVLPEMFATGFSMNAAGIAEDRSGMTETFLAGLARELKCTVIGGLVRRDAGDKATNRAVVVDAHGGVVADYAKLHPFSYGQEGKHYAGGSEVVTFRCGEFVVAPTICYDLRFPELYRAAVRKGVNLMVVIANWPSAREEHWRTLLRARAIENQSYVVGVNRVGADPGNTYGGRSLIIDPRGSIDADGGTVERVVSGELELREVEEYRREFPALADMRKDLQGFN